MSITLTKEQGETIARECENPPRVIDPKSNETYVLLRADVYERVNGILTEDIDPEAMYPLLADLAPEDWEDPVPYGITPRS